MVEENVMGMVYNFDSYIYYGKIVIVTIDRNDYGEKVITEHIISVERAQAIANGLIQAIGCLNDK